MPTSNHVFSIKFYAFMFLLFTFFACSDDSDDTSNEEGVTHEISPDGNVQDEAQTKLIEMQDGEILSFESGQFDFNNTLTVEGKKNIIIQGQGRNNTTLSFANQQAGAEGLKVTNCDKVIVRDLTIENTIGDALKAKDCEQITFRNVATVWTGTPSKDNGAYGLYPVKCNDVLITNCFAEGASDAGIYVGQSNRAIIKNSTATKNVAGIEIENTTEADVFNNHAFDNTGGILIFDLPDLTQFGESVRVFNNLVEENNRSNFASGGIVQNVPAGTGILVMSTNKVEVFNNELLFNNVVNTGVVSLKLIEESNDPDFDPFPKNVEIHNNTFDRSGNLPSSNSLLATAITSNFKNDSIPDILLDGIMDTTQGPSGSICIHDNQNSRFVNLNFTKQESFDLDQSPHICDPQALPKAVVDTI